MPPEPVPWDRRDIRKHERSGSDPRFGAGNFGGGGPQRWREQNHHPHAPPPHPPPYYHQNRHQQQQRWYNDIRSSRPVTPGHGKQGGWHMYSEDVSHGYLPFGSRYGDRNFDEESGRPQASRSDGRYIRNFRERGSFSQKEWKAPSWEPAASSSGPGKPNAEINNRKSVENSQAGRSNNSKSLDSSFHPPDSVKPSEELPSVVKEEHGVNGGTADVCASTGQKDEKENGLGPIDWKPLKWPRSGSLSSRSSGFSHSSSPKSAGVDSIETVAEVQPKNVIPVSSPPADASTHITSSAPTSSDAPTSLDETSSRKKPRLGWGEGLAKYEKKKVESPEDCAMKGGLVVAVNNTETVQSPSVNLLDKSPRVASLSGCTSPATPSSVACSSSPGVEEKDSTKSVNVNQETTNLGCSPSIVSQTRYDGPAFNLENFDLSSIANLSTLINELVQSDDPCSTDTDYMQTSSMNKLLVWKVDILKKIETTESEIECLETEVKSLIAEPMICSPHPASSSSLSGGCLLKSGGDQATVAKFRPPPLQVDPDGDVILEDTPVAVKDEQVMSKDEDVDSPGSATSKFVDVLPAGKDISTSESAHCVEEGSPSLNVSHSNYLNGNSLENGLADVENNSSLAESILASNKDQANRASEELNKLLPAGQCELDVSSSTSFSAMNRDRSLAKENFLRRKRFLQFKENVITLKFKVFRHFWKEGRVLSVRKLRTKSHKKFDLKAGHKKNRTCSRSRVSSSGGNMQTVPADEVIEYVNGLLSEMPFKPYRNNLRMPCLILDKEVKMSRFISNNSLVEDPLAVEKERSSINPWTPKEKETFIDKLATFGKDFKKIASFLDHKTIADCIEFYYKNHKSECFNKARKKSDIKDIKPQPSKYLVAKGERWSREANAASLDMLGVASAIAANVDDGVEIQQKCPSRYFSGAPSSCKTSRSDDGPLQRSSSLDLYSTERETVAADVLAGICGSISSEAMNSCITSSVDPGDGYQDWRCQRVGSSTKRPLTPEVTQNVDDEFSDESRGEMDYTYWTDAEKAIFIQAFSSYGKDFAMISQSLRTRSADQCKMYFSKARKCLGLDLIRPGACNDGSGDVNGGSSDIEDACDVETGSVVCNDVSECRTEDDLTPSNENLNHLSDMVEAHNSKPGFNICEENNGPCLVDSMDAEPVSENSPIGDSQVGEKAVTDFDADNKEQNIVTSECVPIQDNGTTVVSSSIDGLRMEEADDDGYMPNRSSEAENGSLVVVSDGNSEEENGQKGLSLHEDNLNDEKVGDRDANSSGVSGTSCAVGDMKSGVAVSHPFDGSHSLGQVDKASTCQNKADSERNSVDKSSILPVTQNGEVASMKSSTLFSVPIKYQRNPTHDAASAFGTNGIRDEHSQKTVQTGNKLLGYSLSDPVKSSQILRGYPVSVQTMKEMNRNVNGKGSIPLQNVPQRDGILHSDQHAELFSLQRCSGSRHQSKSVESLFPSQEHVRDLSRPQSAGSSDADRPSRKGDVKLFGKILTSSEPKPNSSEVDSSSQHPKLGQQPLSLKFNGDPKVNLDSSQLKFDCNDFMGSENIPVLSGGLWDRNRIQTGFSPLPDSALLLSKYPAAFGNYALPALQLEQPSLPGVVKRNDLPTNSASIFPNKLSSSNGAADYLRNCEIQPFTLDMKQPQEVLFSELQRRNGFDVSAMQQQAMGMVGINRTGVLIGGQCSGVSDPVAAMKMHYANAEQFSLQAGNLMKEDHTWRSNGDLGR